MTLDSTKSSSFFYNYNLYEPVINQSLVPNFSQIPKLVKNEGIVHAELESFDKHVCEYKLDIYFKLKAVSPSLIPEAKKYWSAQHKSCVRRFYFTGTVTVLSGIERVVGTLQSVSPFIITALNILIVTCLIFTGLNLYWAKQAKDQWKEWNKGYYLLPTILKNRKEAYENGFNHIYDYLSKQFLKQFTPGVILDRSEVQFLFEEHAKQFCRDLLKSSKNSTTVQEKETWLKSFQTNNPFSQELLKHVYGNIPEKFIQISNDYEMLAYFLNPNPSNKLTASNLILEFNAQREKKLQPFKAILHYWVNKETQGNLENKTLFKVRYDSFYEIATQSLRSYFDQKVKDAQDYLEEIRKQVQIDKDGNISDIFEGARILLQATKNILEDKTFTYKPFPTSSENFPAPVIDEKIDFLAEARKSRPEGLSDQQYAEYQKFINYEVSVETSK